MARPRRALPVAALLPLMALALLDSGCGGSGGGGGGSDASNQSSGTITLEGTPANDHGTKDVSGTVQVELGDSYFEPTILVGAPGSEVTLELVNNGELEHNINADIPQVDAAVPLDQDVRSGGGKETVKVKFPESGQLLFFCKYHEGDGMVGALRVK
jgi:plastocyanin